MGATFVHGYARGDAGMFAAVRALQTAGFAPREIDVLQQIDDPSGPLVPERRGDRVGRDALWGALGGALFTAPLGAIAPGTLAQVQMSPWFEQLVSTSVAGATLQAVALGAALGAVVGAVRGMYQLRPKPSADTRFLVGVHTETRDAPQAVAALTRSGTMEVETHGA